MGWQGEIVGGTVLRLPRIQSPGFTTGSKGWTINADGSAEFNNIVIRGATTTQGTILFYNGTPAAGNLIGSFAAAAGVDSFGNAYPAGFSATTGIFSGNLSASSISAATIGATNITGSDFAAGTIEGTTMTLDSTGGLILVYATTTVVTTFSSGSGNFTVPAGITSLKVECWGGGAGAAGGGLAGGANSGGEGGGAGAYARLNTMTVTPAQVIPYVVGGGGGGGTPNNLGSNGGVTTFGTTSCVADNGNRATLTSVGIGGAASSSTGDIRFSGGNGGSATSTGGSGGGSSAGTSSSGNRGANNSGSGTAAGGAAVTGGGSGGAGGSANNTGSVGNAPGGGGGGGGGGASAGNGGAGALGKVVITYTSASSLIGSIAPAAGTDSLGNPYPAGISGNFLYQTAAVVTTKTTNTTLGVSVSGKINVVSATITAVAGRRYLIQATYHGVLQGGATSDQFTIAVDRGGTDIASNRAITVASNNTQCGGSISIVDTPGAGSVTYNLTANHETGAASAVVSASATAPCQISVMGFG